MKKFFKGILLTLMLVVGLICGTALSTGTASNIPQPSENYKTNLSGQTYGNVDPRVSISEQVYPDLIAAVGIDGTKGYVYKADLDGDQPKTPEEAVEYMKELDFAINAARRSGDEYFRYIPLYAEDGETVIGEFGISFVEYTN